MTLYTKKKITAWSWQHAKDMKIQKSLWARRNEIEIQQQNMALICKMISLHQSFSLITHDELTKHIATSKIIKIPKLFPKNASGSSLQGINPFV